MGASSGNVSTDAGFGSGFNGGMDSLLRLFISVGNFSSFCATLVKMMTFDQPCAHSFSLSLSLPSPLVTQTAEVAVTAHPNPPYL